MVSMDDVFVDNMGPWVAGAHDTIPLKDVLFLLSVLVARSNRGKLGIGETSIVVAEDQMAL